MDNGELHSESLLLKGQVRHTGAPLFCMTVQMRLTATCKSEVRHDVVRPEF